MLMHNLTKVFLPISYLEEVTDSTECISISKSMVNLFDVYITHFPLLLNKEMY